MPRQIHESPEELLKILSPVNLESSVAVFVQIENLVKFAVAAGKLKTGDQLPSVRELSMLLEVNPNTVAKAYRDLEILQIVWTRRGMGVFIKEGAAKRCQGECKKQVLSRFLEVVSEARACGVSVADLKRALQAATAVEGAPYAVPSLGLLRKMGE